MVPWKKPCGTALALGALDRRAARDLLLDERRGGAFAEVTIVRVISARPGAADGPTQLDRPLDGYAGRDLDVAAVAPEPARELRELVARGERFAALDDGAKPGGIALQPLPEGLHVDARGQVEIAEVVAKPCRAVEDVRANALEQRAPQVDVRRVQVVRLDREGVEGGGGGEPVSAKPVGIVALGRQRLGEGGVGEGEWQVGGRPPSRPRCRCRRSCRWVGCHRASVLETPVPGCCKGAVTPGFEFDISRAGRPLLW